VLKFEMGSKQRLPVWLCGESCVRSRRLSDNHHRVNRAGAAVFHDNVIIPRAEILYRRGRGKTLASIKAVLISHSVFDGNRPVTEFWTRLVHYTNCPNIKGHRI